MFRPGSRFQVPGGVRNPAWGRGMGMRHRGGAKCACRVDPSTSGGAAENTSSMYACNPPEGPSMCQRAQNRSPYYFTPTVAGSSSRDSYVHTCNELLDQFLDPSCNPVARSLNTKHPVPLRHVGSSRHQATRRDTTHKATGLRRQTLSSPAPHARTHACSDPLPGANNARDHAGRAAGGSCSRFENLEHSSANDH